MLLTNRINHLTATYPQLSRVWIKTGDPRTPLKVSGSTSPGCIASPTRPVPRPARARQPNSQRITYWWPEGSLSSFPQEKRA